MLQVMIQCLFTVLMVLFLFQTVEARGAEEGMKADVDCVLSHIGFNMISDREVEVRCALNTNTVVTEKDLCCISYRCKY